MKALPCHIKGFHFTSPDGHLKLHHTFDGFVYDTTIWANNFQDDITSHFVNPLVHTYNDLHAMALWWEELLHATGGKVDMEKCFYYVLQWTFDS